MNKEIIYDTENNPSTHKISCGILTPVSGIVFQEEQGIFGLRRARRFRDLNNMTQSEETKTKEKK